MHYFYNYFECIIYIISFNLFCFIFFRVSVNLIKMRREGVEARVLYTWLQDGPKIIIMKIIIFRIITLG